MTFTCQCCNYSTKYSTHYKKHISSRKHIKREKGAKLKEPVPLLHKSHKYGIYDLKTNITDDNTSDDNDSDINSSSKMPIKTKEHKCKKCDLILCSSSNLIKHMRRCNYVKNDEVDHIKCINSNICPRCFIEFSYKQTFMKHFMSCGNNKDNESTKIKLLHSEYEKKILGEKLKASEKIVEILTEQNKNTNTLAVGNMCNVNGMIETNMRSITFLNKFMNNAPCLEHFNTEFKDPYIFYIDYDEHKKLKKECKLENTKENILYYDEDKMTKDDFIADHIFFLQRNKQTVKFIVERLLYFYKKEGDSIKQSIWNIDMYRYNFTICLKTGNKTLWHSDKQGQTTTEMILDPLLSFTSGIVQKHIESLQKDMQKLAKQKKTNEMLSLLKKVETLTEFILSVKNKELHQEIIRKLSPLLFFDPNKHKDVLQIEE
jgi:hypothetical protein